MSSNRKPRYAFLAALSLAAVTALSGCGAIIVGGTAATTAMVASERRTAGEQVEDNAIELKVANEVRRLYPDTQNMRVNAYSYAGHVLLLGDVPSEEIKQQIGKAAQGVEKVTRVINELRVGDITPVSVRTNDAWLSSKVRTNLINTKDVPFRTINVTTERGVVYLQGRVTATEGQRAAKVASGISGVNKVVKLFDIVLPQDLQKPAAEPAPIEQGGTQSGSNSGSAPETGGAQAMPVQ